jgi:hypothetical protein
VQETGISGGREGGREVVTGSHVNRDVCVALDLRERDRKNNNNEIIDVLLLSTIRPEFNDTF